MSVTETEEFHMVNSLSPSLPSTPFETPFMFFPYRRWGNQGIEG